MPKPAFDPNAPFEPVAGKPAFDPSQPFEAADTAAAGKPAFDPSRPFSAAPAQTDAPVPSGQESVPLPAARPAGAPQAPVSAAPVGPEITVPDVTELDDPGRFRDRYGSQKGMLTGDEAYAELSAKRAGAEAERNEARERLTAAQTRADETSQAPAGRRGGQRQAAKLVIDQELENAKTNLYNAERGVDKARAASPPTVTALRDAATRAAIAPMDMTLGAIGGLARPIDELVFDTGISKNMARGSAILASEGATDRTRDEELTAKFGQAGGSAVGFILTGAIGRAAGLPAAAVSGTVGGLQGAEAEYRHAEMLGADGYKKAMAYLLGGATGASEAFGLGRIVDQMDKGTGGGVKRYFGLILKEMGEEGLQEGAQQLAQNIQRYVNLGEDTGDVTKDVFENALIGATLGMGMSAVIGSPLLLTGRGPLAEELAAQVPSPTPAGVSPEQIQQQVVTAAGGDAADVFAGTTGIVGTPAEPPAPGGTMVVGGTPVPTDPNAPAGTVPPTVVPSEEGVVTTVAVTPGVGTAIPITESKETQDVLSSTQAKADEIGSAPVEGFYSRLFNHVSEKGPTRATAQRWMAWVRRGDFTQEEVTDLGLNNYLNSIGPREKITKQDVLAYLDQQAITLEEIERRPINQDEKAAAVRAIYRHMENVAAGDPTAIRTRPLPPGLVGPDPTEFNRDHPEIAAALAAMAKLDDDKNWAKYQTYTTPGPREGYVELTMHTPKRVSQDVEPLTPPKGEIVFDLTKGETHPFRVMIDGEEFNRTSTRRLAEYELENGMTHAKKRYQQGNREFIGSHYMVPGELFTIRITIRRTLDGQIIALLEELQADILQRAKRVGVLKPNRTSGYVPNLPNKTSWAALGFNRFLLWAAERGIRHVAWADTAEQMRRYPSGDEREDAVRRKGMEAFYYKELEALGKKWKRRTGATLGYTTIPDHPPSAMVYDEATDTMGPERQEPRRFRSLEIPQTGIDYIKAGMPTHASDPMPASGSVVLAPSTPGVGVMDEAQALPLVEALETLLKQLNINSPIAIKLFPDTLKYADQYKTGAKAGQTYYRTHKTARGMLQTWNEGKATQRFEILLAVGQHTSPEQAWVTLIHETGHLIEKTSYAQAPLGVRLAVDAAFDARIAELGPDATLGDLMRRRQNAVDLATHPLYDVNRNLPLSALSPDSYEYNMSKTEWFAELVAKWGSSSEKPLSTVEKFFKGVGRKIRALFNKAFKDITPEVQGIPELNAWLDSIMPGQAQFFAEVMAETNNEGTTANGQHMPAEHTPAPAQVETQTGMDGINGIFNGNPPPAARAAKAHADRFTWMYKWMLGVHQLAVRNPAIAALQQYVSVLDAATDMKNKIMIRALDVMKMWNKLGQEQGDNVGRLLDNLQHMTYRTPAEITAGTARLPTTAEMQAMATQYNVTRRGLVVVREVMTSFQEHLAKIEAALHRENAKVTDPTQQGLNATIITQQMNVLRSKPYFPSMRFGNYTLTIRNAAKQVIHFETFESQRQRTRAVGEIQRKYGVANEQVELGFLDKEARPLLGVPTQLLEAINDKLGLSKIQRDLLEQLKFELAPAHSFQHRFQTKKFVAGYSQDFRRAYANYFFHGGNHLARAMYADDLRRLTRETEEQFVANPGTIPDKTKREKIVAYLTDHTQEWLNPKPDWSSIRAATFLWQLAFSPIAAAANLTQTMLMTGPFLAQRFGDVETVGALSRAFADFTTFYTKGYYAANQTDFEKRAIHKGIEIGLIKESQAAEIAGYADGDMLGKWFGGTAIQRGLLKFNEVGSYMFQMMEQVNRRLAFRATLKLAMENPNAKFVRESVVKRKMEYDEARATMTEAEAAAFVSAVDAVHQTQLRYTKEYSPRIFRGKARTVFVFQTFKLGYLLFLLQPENRGAAVRSLLTMVILAGFAGVPGADELKALVKMLAFYLYEKDVDLEQDARKMIIEMLGEDENGREVAELIMHGIARKGFGIPALMNMAFGTAGMDYRAPNFDVSGNVSMSRILPIDLNAIAGEALQKPEAVISKAAQGASGAAFSVAFSLYQALANTKLDWTDAKRWESAMPRALGDVSEAVRVGTQGYERKTDGTRSVEYDVRDTHQLTEVIGMALGFTPYVKTLQREIDNANYDATHTWQVRRESIMRQYGNAVLGGDDKEIDRAQKHLEHFNDKLPDHAKGYVITSENLKESIEQKAVGRATREAGFSTKKGEIPVMQEVQKLYPESQRVIRKIKPALTP